MRLRVLHVEETGSTNADVVERARAGDPEGVVVVAGSQTAGRGRFGRGWESPPGSGLTFSLLLRPVEVPAPAWSLLPLVAGVGVARGLARAAGVGVRLKWPNDVLLGERKLGGILLERVETAAGPAAVVGVGVNVTLVAADLPVPSATSLLLAGAGDVDRGALLDAVLAEIGGRYDDWRAHAGDAATILPAYREACATLGRSVRAELPDGEVLDARAVDIAADGTLVVETPTGRRMLAAADVVHLR